MCYENKSYHHVQIYGPCVWLAPWMGFFFFWRSIVIILCELKLEVIILEIFPKHLMWSNILFLFQLLAWNPHDHQLSLLFPNGDYLSKKFLLQKSLVIQGSWICYQSCNLSDICGTLLLYRLIHLPIRFWWFLLNLVVNVVGKHWIEKLRDQVLLRLLVQNYLA